MTGFQHIAQNHLAHGAQLLHRTVGTRSETKVEEACYEKRDLNNSSKAHAQQPNIVTVLKLTSGNEFSKSIVIYLVEGKVFSCQYLDLKLS